MVSLLSVPIVAAVGAACLAGAAAVAAADKASFRPEEAMPDGVKNCWL